MSQEAGRNSQAAKGRNCLNEGRHRAKTAILRLQRIKTLGEPSNKKYRAYLYTGAATLLMLSILFLGLHLYPFGDHHISQGHYTLLEQISGQEQEGCILKNEDALPLIFPVEQESHSVEGEGIFSLLNRFWNSITETGGGIFNKAPYEKVVVQKDSGKEIQVHFTAVDSNPVYAYIPGGEGISVEGISEGADLSYSANQDIVYVGTFVEGEVLIVK